MIIFVIVCAKIHATGDPRKWSRGFFIASNTTFHTLSVVTGLDGRGVSRLIEIWLLYHYLSGSHWLKQQSNDNESWWELKLSLTFQRQLSCTLVDFILVQILIRVFATRAVSLINSHATLVLVWPGHESWENSHANSRFSTLINSHANSRFSTLINSHANSCSHLTGAWELRKLSCKLSLLNSHQLSCKLLFSFDRAMRVEKTLMQTLASQLSSTLMQTLVLIWPGHESWENSHANSRFSTLIQPLFSFHRGMRIEKTLASQLSSILMQILASQLSSSLMQTPLASQLSCKLSLLNSHQLSCNSCSRLTGAWELRKLSCKLSLLNSHPELYRCWRLTWFSNASGAKVLYVCATWVAKSCRRLSIESS